MKQINIILKPKNVVCFLALTITCLTVFYLVCQIAKFYLGHENLFGLVSLFDLNLEYSIPSVFSSLILLFSAIILTVIACLKKRDGGCFYLHWAGLAAVFFFLFVDESVAIHEIIGTRIRMSLNTSGFLYYAWIIPYSIILLAFVIGYLKFLIHLPIQTGLLFIAAGLIFIVGAIGIEMLGGYHDELHGQQTITYAILVLFEELFEMIGITIFVYALLSYVYSEYKDLGFRIVFSEQVTSSNR